MKNKLLKNGFYNITTGVVRIGLGVITIPVLIRLIGVEEYGLWILASTVVALAALAEVGLSVATTVFISQDLAQEDIKGLSDTVTITFGLMLLLATIALIALWIGADNIVAMFPKLEQSEQLTFVRAIQIGGWVVWARLLQQVLIGVEQAYQRYDLMNILNTIQSVLINLGLCVIAMQDGTTVSLMQWQALASIAVLLTHIIVVRYLFLGVKLTLSWNKHKVISVGHYSLMMWLTSLGGTLFSRGDRIIVGNLLGNQGLAIYAAITDITVQINSLSALSVQPLLTRLSSFKNDYNNRKQCNQEIKQAIEINSFVALGIAETLLTFRSEIFNLISPEKPSDLYIYSFLIAIVIYAIYSINGVGYYILIGLNKVHLCMTIQIISGIFSMFIIAICGKTFGLIGAIFGNIGYLGVWLLNILGMQMLLIPLLQWIKWIKLPLIWFILFAIVNILTPDLFFIKIFIFILQSFLLVSWFFHVNKDNIGFATLRLFRKC